MRHRGVAAGAAIVILGVLIVPVFSLTTGETSASALAKTGAAHDAYARLQRGGVLERRADPDRGARPLRAGRERAAPAWPRCPGSRRR